MRPPCLDSGTTLRYDSLTWSDGPPSCEPFVRCSALLPTFTPNGTFCDLHSCPFLPVAVLACHCLGALSMHCLP